MRKPFAALVAIAFATACTAGDTLEPGKGEPLPADEPVGDGKSDGVLVEDAEPLDSEPAPSALAVAAGCIAAPTGMKWQTPWDATNTWSGAGVAQAGPFHYNEPGTFHVGCTGSYPQFYAIDWLASFRARVYSSIPGRVIWAGDSPFAANSLGKYVAVEHVYQGNRYVAIHAHLNEVYVKRGQIVNDSWDLGDPNSLPNVVIGRAGRTDVPAGAAVHLHHSTLFNPSYNSFGEPFGGRSVMPTRVRCFACRNGEGGYYTRFVRAGNYRY